MAAPFCYLVLICSILFTPCCAQVAQHKRTIDLAKWDYAQYEPYLIAAAMLIFVVIFKAFYPKIPYIPEYFPQSLILIIIGASFCAILNALSVDLSSTPLVLTPPMFFNFLLPPIVLDSSYSLANRTFGDFLVSVLIYAVFGTLVNFFLIGPIMYGLQIGGAMEPGLIPIPLSCHLLFSSLIVAVDPVAVLAIFQEIGVNLGLYYTVFGESLLNDAVTVVLYEIMLKFAAATSVTSAEVGLGIASFFTISFGGVIIGLLIGVISCILTRWEFPFGSVFLILAAYISYYVTNCVGWSGIIAMICCGLVHAGYAFHNLSDSTLSTLEGFVKQVSEVSEALIFFLLGVQILITKLRWSTGFCLWAFVVCTFARAVSVLVLAQLINVLHINSMRIKFREQFIMICGGLRGAVAFSLAFLLKDEQDVPDEISRIFITCALFIIFITVGFQGLTMKPLVHLARIKLDQKKKLSILTDLTCRFIDHSLSAMESIVGSVGRNRFRDSITRFDVKFIRRVLQRDPEGHDKKMVKTYEEIAMKLHLATVKSEASPEYLQDLPVPVIRQFLRGEIETDDGAPPQTRMRFATQEVVREGPIKRSQSMQLRRHRISPNADEAEPLPDWVRPTNMIPNPDHRDENFEMMYLNALRKKSIELSHRHRDEEYQQSPSESVPHMVVVRTDSET